MQFHRLLSLSWGSEFNVAETTSTTILVLSDYDRSDVSGFVKESTNGIFSGGEANVTAEQGVAFTCRNSRLCSPAFLAAVFY
jgi:hypothetical protein